MLKLIITKDTNTELYDLTDTFDKSLLDEISTISLQDNEKTMIININSNASSVFSKVVEIIQELNVQIINQLKTYFDDILSNKNLTEPILDELKALLTNIDFKYEIIESLETAAGEDENLDSSFFIYQNEDNLSNEYILNQRESLVSTNESTQTEKRLSTSVDFDFTSNSTALTSGGENPLDGETISITSITEDTGVSSSDYITRDNTLKMNGTSTAPEGSNIKVSIDSDFLITTVDADGKWEIDYKGTSLADGSYTVSVSLVDEAGNEAVTATQNIVIDTQATNRPSISNVVDTNSDLSSVVISGTGTEVGNTIKVYDAGNSLIGTAIVSSNLTWSITTTSLSSNQEYAFRADETDIAGNISSDSNIVTIITTTSGYYVVDASTDYILGSSDDNIISVEADDLNNSLVIDGGEGNDTVSFRNLTAGTTIDMNAETNTIGDDSITLLNIEDVYGSEVGDDTIIGNAEDNLLYGGGGNDVLHGGDGDDYLLGDQGALKEDNNDDILYGDAGNDTLVGGHGNDTLYGGDDDDSLHGQRGDDRLIGGAGDDNIRADGGIDTVVFSGNLSDYTTVKISSTQFTITDIRDGSPDGTDTISRAEFIEFADQTVSTTIIPSVSADLLASSDKGISSIDNITDDTTPIFRVTLSSSAIEGCKVAIYIDGTRTEAQVITQVDIDNGYVDVEMSEFTSVGSYEVTTSILNLLGLSGSKTDSITLVIDSTSTPLILDLDGDGVETISKEEGTLFDIDADGDKDKTGWVGADDGLLVRDINKDGIINDASELFGEHTIKDDGSKAKDGFDALSELDSNNDGVINQEDDAFDELQVWKDLNSDGITNDGELISLAEANIKEISLENEVDDTIDNGNTIGLKGTYTNSDGKEEEISDVWFSYEENIQNENIDLSNTPKIDLLNNKKDVLSLNFESLLDMKDENNELIILGDKYDNVLLPGGIKSGDNAEGMWENTGIRNDEEGRSYNIYQSNKEDSLITLLIESQIDINNI